MRTTPTSHDARLSLPETETGWRDRYNWLFDWYSGRDYDGVDHQLLKLFSAVDKDLNLLVATERLQRDAQYVVETDARALGSGDWSLERSRNAGVDRALTRGEAIWHRSRIQAQKHGWIKQAAILGDYFIEAVREQDGRVRLYGYDPRWCEVIYDDAGLNIERLTVTLSAFLDSHNSVLTTQRRTITRDSIVVEDLGDNGWQIAGAGEHGLGLAPAVQIRQGEVAGLPEHGLWAGFGLDKPMQALDSMYAQLHAIFRRYAHPHMIVSGARLSDPDVEQFGRIIEGLPHDAKIQYLESGMAAVQAMTQAIKEYREDTRATIPEFVRSVGANTSGKAYELRMDDLKRKLREVQGRHNEAFGRVTQMAYHMEDGSVYDEDTDLYRVRNPPLLPKDEPQTARTMVELRAAGLISRTDAVRHLQAAGIIDHEVDPAAYADGLAEESLIQQLTPTPTPDSLGTEE